MMQRQTAQATGGTAPVTGRTALVTGGNKGIGHEIARRLAADGYTVWIGARDRARGEAAVAELAGPDADVRLLVLDVTDDDSVAEAVKALSWETDCLDVLVNNAGIATGFGQTPSQESIADVKAVYEVNVFGPIRVTQAFLPLLKASKAARVVMVSSGLASLGLALDPTSPFYGVNFLAYNTSKTALNAVTVVLAKELDPLGIKINAADPGYTATDLNRHSGPRTVQQGAEIAVRLANLGPDGPTAGFFNDRGAEPW